MLTSDGWEGILLGRWCIVDGSQEFFFENLVNWSVKYDVYHDEIHPAGGVWNLKHVANIMSWTRSFGCGDEIHPVNMLQVNFITQRLGVNSKSTHHAFSLLKVDMGVS